MNLLENYIRGYLLKEQINSADHQLIEKTMKELDRNLRSMTPSMSLDTLSFDSRIISNLKDYRPLKDVGERKTEPESLDINFPQQSLNKFNMKNKPAIFNIPGLGFNPLDKLKSEKPYYIRKIQELIDVYEKADTDEWEPIIKTLHDCLNLRYAIKRTNLKVLGAGLYRIVVTIPGLDEIVVKIGLGDKGRDDCRKEIDFSDGKGASRLEHQKNFPTIYSRSDNKSWYAIEKAVFFSDKKFKGDKDSDDNSGKNEIKKDIEEQFSNTMFFLEEILDKFKLKEIDNFKDNTKWKMFRKYLYTIFKKDKSYQQEHEKETSNLSARNKKISVDLKITKNIFKKKLEIFLNEIGFSLSWNSSFTDKDIDMKDVKNKIISNHLNEKSVNVMLNEIGSMFDQAVVTNIRDLHTGNMGFKKNDQDKWQLIFTDIDSK